LFAGYAGPAYGEGFANGRKPQPALRRARLVLVAVSSAFLERQSFSQIGATCGAGAIRLTPASPFRRQLRPGSAADRAGVEDADFHRRHPCAKRQCMDGEVTLEFLGAQIERLLREVRDLRDVIAATETKLTTIERQGLENARALLQLQLDIGTTIKLEMAPQCSS
jgi:hypothetical protein